MSHRPLVLTHSLEAAANNVEIHTHRAIGGDSRACSPHRWQNYMTFVFEFDLERVKVEGHAMWPKVISRPKLIVRTHTQTHSDSGPITLHGLLMYEEREGD